MQRSLLALAVAGAATLPWPAAAADDAEVARLRADFEQQLHSLRSSYEDRLKALESRLDSAAGKANASPTAVDRVERPPVNANSFNPELSLILQGTYVSRKSGERRPTGYLQDEEIGASQRGFSLNDTELVIGANIDPYFRGSATIILADDQAELEEAWFQTLNLDKGFVLKGGRFISGIGYQNAQHPHSWDFSDNNLMYQVLFGEHLVQDGLQLKWLAPVDTFLELGAEIGSGAAFPGSDGDHNDPGAWAVYGHIGGDVGDTSSWRAGLSYLSAEPRDRASTLIDSSGTEAETSFTGRSKTWIADFVWKMAPDGNPKDRNFKLQAEFFQRDESGDLTCLDNSAEGGACLADTTAAYRADQTGWYAQGIWQFMPRWRVGLRYDRLNQGSLDYGINDAALSSGSYDPNKWTLMTDYAPSEFSLIRLQLARNHAMADNPDNSEISLQYIYSMGAHSAHSF